MPVIWQVPGSVDRDLSRSGYTRQFTKQKAPDHAVDNLTASALFGHVVRG